MQKLFKLFKENLSEISIDIMFYGCVLSTGLLLIGIFAYKANILFWNENYTNIIWSIKIITSAMSLFVQSFFFGLIFDCVRLSIKR